MSASPPPHAGSYVRLDRAQLNARHLGQAGESHMPAVRV